MVVIVDERARVRSISLRERLLAEGVPCALCSLDTLSHLSAAPVTVCFATDRDHLFRVSLRAGDTALIALDLSGGRLYDPDAVIWDESLHGDLVHFIIKTLWDRAGIDPRDVRAGDVSIISGEAYFKFRYLKLTDTERLILSHLSIHPDTFHTEREVRKFVCDVGDLRRRRSSVSVHIANINKKAIRAVGEKMIVCKRNHGYAVMTSPSPKPKKYGKPGFVPPFT